MQKSHPLVSVGPPLWNYVTGYSGPGIAKLKRELIQEGVGPVKATAAATLTKLSAALNDAAFFYQYPDDVEMLGLRFNTTTMGTGTAYFGEIAHHFDAPMPIHSGDVLPAILPGATQFLGPLLGASQTLINVEFASLYIWAHDVDGVSPVGA